MNDTVWAAWWSHWDLNYTGEHLFQNRPTRSEVLQHVITDLDIAPEDRQIFDKGFEFRIQQLQVIRN